MLSVIANFFNMRRQAPNTLFSLSRQYQQNMAGLDYHVLAIDNGSPEPLSESDVRGFGPEFSFSFFPTQSPSPVEALNAACRNAPGEDLLILIDGAHILSPGILAWAHRALHAFDSPFVATTCLHLGPNVQNASIAQGYSPDVEEKLLQQVAWRSNGYNLYSIAGNFADDATGWFGCLYESGCFAMKKSAFLELGGFDARFQSPGGGLANLDFFLRALAAHDSPVRPYIVLLGEATFHQIHGGISTNAPVERHPWHQFHDEFIRIRGHPYQRLPRRPIYLGAIPPQAQHASRVSAQHGLDWWQKYVPSETTT